MKSSPRPIFPPTSRRRPRSPYYLSNLLFLFIHLVAVFLRLTHALLHLFLASLDFVLDISQQLFFFLPKPFQYRSRLLTQTIGSLDSY